MGWFSKKKRAIEESQEIKSIFNNMNLETIVVKKGMKIKCPICNKYTFAEDSKQIGSGLIHWMRDPWEIECEHISADIYIMKYQLENIPDAYYNNIISSKKDIEIIENINTFMEADLYMPNLIINVARSPYELIVFLKDRKPDYCIKINDNENEDMMGTKYFFFKSSGFGMFDTE
jgi:hypothetical protein